MMMIIIIVIIILTVAVLPHELYSQNSGSIICNEKIKNKKQINSQCFSNSSLSNFVTSINK